MISFCQYVDAAKPGDVLVLTKPLGNQLAVNAHQWLISNPTKWETIKDAITEQEVIDAYEYAITSMIRLNRTAARLMKEYGAHAATDVTGFGILGHASNLAKNQKEKVRFVIDTLPVIQHMIKFEKARPVFKLLEGRSSESSGGLLIAFPSSPGSNPLELAQRFCKDLEQQDGGHPCFIIGRVIEGEGTRIYLLLFLFIF